MRRTSSIRRAYQRAKKFHLFSYHARGTLDVMAHVNTETVVIRRASAEDLDALRYLAALDSARALMGDVLVAESDGIVRAAYSVDEQRAIADPFLPTAHLVTLLQTRAAPLREARPKRNRGPSSVVRALPARP
jgi:uncharacterized protein (DUF849 family)